jgi:JmjC domain
MVSQLQWHPPDIGRIALVDAFPDEAIGFVHGLHHDERLSLASIADLADRLPRTSVIYDSAAQPLLVPEGGPPRGALAQPGDVIRNLRTANAWLTLLHADADPVMAQIMNTHLDRLEERIAATQGPMRNRVAFVFVSSPNSVTPVHFDIEHSLLMQVTGTKTVSIGRYATDAVARREVERYWDGSCGRIEDLPEEVASFTLTPGRGVYIPPGTPHWVRNGPDVSASVTLTYFTVATVRENRIQDFNSLMRRTHLSPRPPGSSRLVDTGKVCAMALVALGRRLRPPADRKGTRDTSANLEQVDRCAENDTRDRVRENLRQPHK